MVKKILADPTATVYRGLLLGTEFVDPLDDRKKQLNVIDNRLERIGKEIMEQEGLIKSRAKLPYIISFEGIIGLLAVLRLTNKPGKSP